MQFEEPRISLILWRVTKHKDVYQKRDQIVKAAGHLEKTLNNGTLPLRMTTSLSPMEALKSDGSLALQVFFWPVDQ